MKRSVLVIGGILMLVLLLAGAAFVGGRLLDKEQPAGIAGGPIAVGEGGGAPVSIEVQMEGAEELPDAPPDVVGTFARREDNSIFVNEASGGIAVSVNESEADAAGGGIVVSESGPDTAGGRQIEIVVTGDTIVYKDVTNLEGPPSSRTIQQKVAPGSIDEIGENSVVLAWGERRGDRLVTRVLVYSEPVMITAPGGN